MVIGVAYTDVKGDFAENVPYIIDTLDENILPILYDLSKAGYKNITPFYYYGEGDERTPEIITWDFVRKHKKNF